jgi:hypothetical protein
MRLPLLAALLCLLLPVVAPAAAGAPGTAPATAPDPAGQATPAALPSTDSTQSALSSQSNATLPPENTTLTVHLEQDGDARWTVTTVFVLEDENDTRAFDRLASQFESGDASTSFDRSTFEDAADRADVDREMEIRNVSYTSDRAPSGNVSVGRLTMELRWTNFARAQGDRLVVDDAFNTSSGTWLPGLANNQRLVVVAPPDYLVFDSPRNVGVQQGTISWEGPTDFEPGYIDVTYERTGSTPSSSPPTTSPGTGPGADLSLFAAAGIGLGALAIGAFVWYRRRPDLGDPGGVTDDDEPPAPPAAGEEASTNGAGGVAASGEPDQEVDLDLLSDEERVEYLLRQNGGRMKQATIVKETGWSNAKVSQLLSRMDDDERVDKLRIGRENLISLPDEDVAEFDEQ